MGTLLNRYHASSDRERFNKKQTSAQQLAALRTLSYGVSAITGEFGTLIELRLAIIHEGEKIPGRTAEQSLQMVDETLDWYRDLALNSSRGSLIPRGAWWTMGIFIFGTAIYAALPYIYRLASSAP